MSIIQKIKNKILWQNSKWYEKYIDKQIRILKKIAAYNGVSKVAESIDRVYIEKFIEDNKQYIKGTVLEFKGTENYAHRYTGPRDKIRYCAGLKYYDIYKKFKDINYFFELEDISTYPKEKFDCIIFTQCLPYFLDPVKILSNVVTMLKPKGVILICSDMFSKNIPEAPFLTYITEQGLKYACSELIKMRGGGLIAIKSYGNINSALRNMLNIKRYNLTEYHNDYSSNYPVLITAVYQK